MPDIVWHIRLQSAPHHVFALLTTDEGRGSFWAERTEEQEGVVLFHFPNGEVLRSRIIESLPPQRFSLTYFGESMVTFELEKAGDGTDLTLTESGVREDELSENRAGWVSVLLNLKARADFGVDLRNHDARLTWSDGYVDN